MLQVLFLNIHIINFWLSKREKNKSLYFANRVVLSENGLTGCVSPGSKMKKTYFTFGQASTLYLDTYIDKKLMMSDDTLAYNYKGETDIQLGVLNMVDDTLAISKCGTTHVLKNAVINAFITAQRLTLTKKKELCPSCGLDLSAKTLSNPTGKFS